MRAIANSGNSRAGHLARPVCRWRQAFKPAAPPKGAVVACMVNKGQEPVQCQDWSVRGEQALSAAVAGLLASGVLCTATPALAEIQTVSPQTATQMARPLPKQTVDKGKVWLVFIGGAALLFGSTILAESNEAWFPAIVRANRAMAEAAKRAKEQEEKMATAQKVLEQKQAEWDANQRQVRAVEEGLAGARNKVLADKTSGSSSGTAASVVSAEPVATTATSSSNGAAADASGAAAAVPKSTREELIAMLKAEDDAAAAAAAAAATPVASHTDPAASGTDSATLPAASSSAHSAAAPDAAAAAPAKNGNAAAIGVGTVLHDLASSNGQAEARKAEPDTETDDEFAARSARLQNFVSSTVSGGKTPLELFKEQQRQQYRQQ